MNECQSNPCSTRGRCVDRRGAYVCECDDGYAGTNCEKDINECSSLPCENNGKCVDIVRPTLMLNLCHVRRHVLRLCLRWQVDGFECRCLKGFEGLRCEVNINECYSMPCANRGICTDLINSYTCECPPGYRGDNCQVDINECESEPCLNKVLLHLHMCR